MSDQTHKAEIDAALSPDNEPKRYHPRCGSIQCAECYPGWGERYNEAVAARVIRAETTRVTPPGMSD